MNQRNLILGFLILITTFFGTFVVYDIQKNKKAAQQQSAQLKNWNWDDNWSDNSPSNPSTPIKVQPDVPMQQIVAGSYQEALKKSGEIGKPVFVFFTANWCSYCQKMKSETFEDLKVKSALKNYILVIVDTDKDRDGVRRFNIDKLPSYVITNYKEESLKSGNGYKTAESMAAWLDNPSLYTQPKQPVEASPDVKPEQPKESQPNDRPRRNERQPRRPFRHQQPPQFNPGGG